MKCQMSLARKHDYFTRENNMLSSHVKRSPLLWLHNGTFRSKSETVWDFIGVYIINRTLHGHLELRNFSKKNFISPSSHVHVISSFYLISRVGTDDQQTSIRLEIVSFKIC